MPRKKSKKGTVRSAALNVHHKNSKAEQVADLKKALKRADVVSLSEVRSNGLLAWARANGYGVYKASGKGADNALVWNKNRVSLARPGKSIKLNQREGSTGGMRSRFAAYAMFTDKATGTNFWQIAAHTTPPRQGRPGVRSAIRDEQYDTLAALAKQLSKSGAVILAGDLNFKNPQIQGLKNATNGGVMHVLSSGATNVTDRINVNSDHALVITSTNLDGSAGGDGSGKQLLGQYGWVQGMDREEARAADIVGGPGVKPVKPVEADYLPGGRFYGLMAYSVAVKHYNHAMDAFKNGYWYHANGLAYTRAQRDHNVALAASGKFNTKYGLPSASYDEQLAGRSRHGSYTFENGMWGYHGTKGAGGGTGGGPGGGAGGDGSGPKPGGLTEYRGMAGNAYVAPTFQGFWEGDMGGGPMQVAPGAAPKQNGAALFQAGQYQATPPGGLPTSQPQPGSAPVTQSSGWTNLPGGTEQNGIDLAGRRRAAEASYWKDVINAQLMGWATPTNPGGMYSKTMPTWLTTQTIYDPVNGSVVSTPGMFTNPLGSATGLQDGSIRPDINTATTQELSSKVSSGYFLENAW
jgi:hypothetical protein